MITVFFQTYFDELSYFSNRMIIMFGKFYQIKLIYHNTYFTIHTNGFWTPLSHPFPLLSSAWSFLIWPWKISCFFGQLNLLSLYFFFFSFYFFFPFLSSYRLLRILIFIRHFTSSFSLSISAFSLSKLLQNFTH